MGTDGIDDDIGQFLARAASVELIEVLLLIRRASGVVSAAEIARELGSQVPSIDRHLRHLQELGMLEARAAGYAFAPRDEKLADFAARLERTYRDRRMKVITLIYEPKPSDLQLFSDAFRLRERKPGDQR